MEINSQGSHRRENAQSIVEFALVLPLLLVLLLGIIEVGRLLFIYTAVSTSSREAARYGSAAGDIGGYVAHYQDCDGMRAAARRVGILAGIRDENIAINYDNGNNAGSFGSCPVGGLGSADVDLGNRVVVQVNAAYQPIVSLVHLPSFTISSTARRTILKDIWIEGTPPAVNTPTVRFESSGQVRSESDGTAVIVVRLSNIGSHAVTVPYTLSGSAALGADYTIAPSGQLVIHAGDTSGEIRVTIIDDPLNEDPEQIVVVMGTPTGAFKGSPDVHTIRILDNDLPPTVSFTSSGQSWPESVGTIAITAQLDKPSGKTVSVPFDVSDTSTATPDVDYTISASPLVFAPGSTSQQILIPVVPDDLYEDDESILVNMGMPTNAYRGTPSQHTAWITNDDAPPVVTFTWESQQVAENAGSAIVQVKLSAASGKPVTLPVQVSGTATQGTDYTISTTFPLQFAPGTVSSNIVIPVVSDVEEEEDETLVLTMGIPTDATLGTPSVHTLTIMNFVPPPTVAFASAALSKLENGGNLAVVVQLSAATNLDVTVPFSLGGTATSGADYTPPAVNQVVIPAGSASATITIPLVNDVLDEDDETVVVTMGTPTNAIKGVPSVHTATILDDDTATVAFTTDSQSRREDLGAVQILVQLSIPSTKDVTVPFTTSGTATKGSDYTITPSPLVIPAGSLTASIQVKLIDDTQEEPDETVVVSLGTPTNASRGVPATHTLTILDNDAPTCQIFTDNELYMNTNDKIISWTISNLSQDPLVLKSLTVAWPDQGRDAPKFDYVRFISALIWDGNVPQSPSTQTSWLGFASDRTLLSTPTTITAGFTRELQAGDYSLTLVFRNTRLGIDCTAITSSKTLTAP